MPYIEQKERPQFEEGLEKLNPKTKGQLTYIFCMIVMKYVLSKKESYTNYSDALGALSDTDAEVRRRWLFPYEDKKIAENGDILKGRVEPEQMTWIDIPSYTKAKLSDSHPKTQEEVLDLLTKEAEEMGFYNDNQPNLQSQEEVDKLLKAAEERARSYEPTPEDVENKLMEGLEDHKEDDFGVYVAMYDLARGDGYAPGPSDVFARSVKDLYNRIDENYNDYIDEKFHSMEDDEENASFMEYFNNVATNFLEARVTTLEKTVEQIEKQKPYFVDKWYL